MTSRDRAATTRALLSFGTSIIWSRLFSVMLDCCNRLPAVSICSLGMYLGMAAVRKYMFKTVYGIFGMNGTSET